MPKIVNHEERRDELAEAVWAVVERDGVAGASVRSVALQAGWTRGVIGHYFRTHDELLLYAYRLALRRGTRPRPSEAGLTPTQRLVEALMRALPVDAESTVDFKIWLGFMGRVADDPGLAEAVRKEHAEQQAGIRELVEECVASGELHPPFGLDEATEMLVVFVDGLGTAAALDPQAYTVPYLESVLRRFLGTWQVSARGS